VVPGRWYQVGDLCRILPSPLARSSVLRVRCIVAALLRCAPVWYHPPTAILLPHRAALAVVEDAVGGLGGVQLLDQQLGGQELGPPTLGPFLPTPGWPGPLPEGNKARKRSAGGHFFLGRRGVGWRGVCDPLSEQEEGTRTPLSAFSPSCHRREIRRGWGGGERGYPPPYHPWCFDTFPYKPGGVLSKAPAATLPAPC